MLTALEIGKRIADARQRKNLTQADLAEALGVARTTVVAMEKGTRRPTDSELVQLAPALGVGLHELLRPHYVASEVMVRFRSSAGSADAPVDPSVRRLEQLGRQYVELESIMQAGQISAPLAELTSFFRAASRSPGGAAREARRLGQQAARTVRNLLGLGDAPVADLESVLEIEAGLRIFHLRDMPQGVSAMLVWGQDIGACVGLNANHPKPRRKWSLAHEFGHFLHDREAGDLLPLAGPGRMDASEHFAEGCASELLLPASGVSRQFEERKRLGGGKFLVADIIEMRHHYGVSFQAMTLRLEELEHLPSGTYSRVQEGRFQQKKEEQKLGFTADRETPSLLPDRYVDLALSALDDGRISESEACRYLETSRVQVREQLDSRRDQRDDSGQMLQLQLFQDLLGASDRETDKVALA